jgi:hypothetical protein
MSCGCNQNLAHRRPISPDYVGDPGYPVEESYLFNDRGPLSLDILDPLAFQGRDERGDLIPFIMANQPQVNPNGCQFSGKELNNYGPYDYPDWIL